MELKTPELKDNEIWPSAYTVYVPATVCVEVIIYSSSTVQKS